MPTARCTSRRSHVVLLSLLTLCVLGSACEAMPAFETPQMSVQKVKLKTLHHDGFDFDVFVKAQNSNTIGIFADTLSYRVFVEGQEVAGGERSERIEVKAGGERSVTLPMNARYRDVSATWKRMRGKTLWNWEVKGELGFDTPVGKIVLPFTGGDVFPAPALPEIRFKKPRVKRIDLRGVTLAVSAYIKNPNGFDLPAGEARFQVEMMKKTFDIAPVEIPIIAARSEGVFNIEQRLSAKDLSATVMRALTRPTIKARLKGELKIGEIKTPVDHQVVFKR